MYVPSWPVIPVISATFVKESPYFAPNYYATGDRTLIILKNVAPFAKAYLLNLYKLIDVPYFVNFTSNCYYLVRSRRTTWIFSCYNPSFWMKLFFLWSQRINLRNLDAKFNYI